MTKVVIAGGTGALGRRISDDLADRGYDVVVLTRSPKPGRFSGTVSRSATGQENSTAPR